MVEKHQHIPDNPWRRGGKCHTHVNSVATAGALISEKATCISFLRDSAGAVTFNLAFIESSMALFFTSNTRMVMPILRVDESEGWKYQGHENTHGILHGRLLGFDARIYRSGGAMSMMLFAPLERGIGSHVEVYDSTSVMGREDQPAIDLELFSKKQVFQDEPELLF